MMSGALPNIHILGIQGSGKGTQSARLVKEFGLLYVASGNLFRGRAAKGDQLGQEIATELSKGKLLPDEILVKTIDDYLATQSPLRIGVLGDGVIRTKRQLELLAPIWEKYALEQPFLIHLELDQETARQRIIKRQQEQHLPEMRDYHATFSGKLIHRSDDNPLAIEERFALFHAMTEPIITQFQSSGRYARIDASKTPEGVYDEIKSCLGSFYPHLTHGINQISE